MDNKKNILKKAVLVISAVTVLFFSLVVPSFAYDVVNSENPSITGEYYYSFGFTPYYIGFSGDTSAEPYDPNLYYEDLNIELNYTYNPSVFVDDERGTYYHQETSKISVAGVQGDTSSPRYYANVGSTTSFDNNANYLEKIKALYPDAEFKRSITHFGYERYDDLRSSIVIKAKDFGLDLGVSSIPYITCPFFMYEANQEMFGYTSVRPAVYVKAHYYYLDNDSTMREGTIDTVYSSNISYFTNTRRVDIMPYYAGAAIDSNFVYYDYFEAEVALVDSSLSVPSVSEWRSFVDANALPIDGELSNNTLAKKQFNGSGFYLYNVYSNNAELHREKISNIFENDAKIVYRNYTSITEWLGGVTSNFLNIDLLPGLNLASLVGVLLSIFVTLWLLRVMAGG